MVQLKEVPATLLVSDIAVGLPEHIVCDGGTAFANGIGFTVTGTVIGAPTHPVPLAVGVTV
jgi:hypothetical protein